jgi:hypothetical protein
MIASGLEYQKPGSLSRSAIPIELVVGKLHLAVLVLRVADS